MMNKWLVIVIFVFFLGCFYIIAQGINNSQNATLNAISELKDEVQALQAALEVHNAKPYWWEADNGDTGVQDQSTG